MIGEFYKDHDNDKIYWKDTSDLDGEIIFSFDKKEEFYLFGDYPDKCTISDVKKIDYYLRSIRPEQ